MLNPLAHTLKPWRHAAAITALLLPLAAGAACPALTRVGISDLGYAAFRDGASYRGVSVDVVVQLRRRTGCKFRIDWYPRGRLFVEFANGRIDMTLAALRSPERDRYAVWIPYAYTRFDLLLTNRSGDNFHSLADFVERGSGRLNITRGISYTPAVQAQIARLEQAGRLEYVNDYDTVFNKIRAGRAEGTLAPPIIHALHLRRFGLEGKMTAFTIPEWPNSMTGVYLSSSTLTDEVRQTYADAIYGMVADGSAQKIYARYLGPDVARQVYANGSHDILELIRR